MFRFNSKRFIALCLAGFLVVSLSSCRFMPNRKTDVASVTKRFQKTLDGLRKEEGFPGATAAFVLPDGTVVGVATGFSDLEKQTTMSKDAQQPIGTVEESFLAFAAISLDQEGIVSLDERVYRYFDSDEEDVWISLLPDGELLTLRHLLTHSSGLVDSATDGDGEASTASEESRNASVRRSLRNIAFAVEAESGFAPGEGFAVVDTDYRFVRMVLEQASDETYEELLEKRVLNAFGLTLTQSLADAELENVSSGYIESVGPSDTTTQVNSLESLVTDREFDRTEDVLLSNPQDLVRWAQLLYEEDALEKAYMEELFASGYRGKNRSSEFGLGVYVHETTAGEAYGHSSAGDGYATNLIYFPKYKVGVCVQVNRDHGNDLRRYVETLAQVVLNSLPD